MPNQYTRNPEVIHEMQKRARQQQSCRYGYDAGFDVAQWMDKAVAVADRYIYILIAIAMAWVLVHLIRFVALGA